MNKNEFLQRIRQNLSALPDEEIRNVINYYIEYFEDGNIGDDIDVTKSLGNPDKVASEILQDYKVNDNSSKGGMQRRNYNPNVNYNSNGNYNGNRNYYGNGNGRVNYNNQGNINNMYKQKSGNSWKVVLIILGIIFSPVLLGLLIGALGIALGIICAVIGVIGGIIAAALGIIAGGIACTVVSFFVITQSFATFAFYFGCGLIMLALGITILYFEIIAIKKIISLLLNRKKKGGKTLVC